VADTPKDRADALVRALAATEGKGEQAQANAVQYLMAAISPPSSQSVTDDLWRWLVRGLVLLLVADLIGLLVIVARGNSPDALLTIFTTSLAGLLGLFAPSPTKG
jgi:hypothetical protein